MFHRPRLINLIYAQAILFPDLYRPPKGGEKYFALLSVEAVNSEDPDYVLKYRANRRFEKLDTSLS